MTPKKLVLALLASSLVFAGTATARPVEETLRGVGPGYFASDNIEYISSIPINLDSAGARKLGKYFYITTSNGLTIYDVSKPEAPQRLGFLPMPQQPYYAEEDVDTNGRILLISTFSTLYVVDVEDKTNPQVLSQLSGAAQHTWTCVLSCRWAYGSEGLIADLRDPTDPKKAGNWTEGLPVRGAHDVTEVKPGFIVASSNPIVYLDARTPDKPKLIGSGSTDDGRYMHGNLWPRGGKDKFLLVGAEKLGPQCKEGDGSSFMVWDASKINKTRTFTMIDEYYVKNGLPTDGDAPANLFCTHWFDTKPGFKNGGFVAMGWYEHGTRFFEITKKGAIEEAGYFLPFAGSTSGAYWISDDILYTADYNRGIDIIRFTPPSQ
jgi:hypothetical protein